MNLYIHIQIHTGKLVRSRQTLHKCKKAKCKTRKESVATVTPLRDCNAHYTGKKHCEIKLKVPIYLVLGSCGDVNVKKKKNWLKHVVSKSQYLIPCEPKSEKWTCQCNIVFFVCCVLCVEVESSLLTFPVTLYINHEALVEHE